MRKMTFGKGKPLSRRKFIVGSAAIAGGGLALGLNVPFAHGQQNGAASEINVWVAIKTGRHLRHPHRALGNGAGYAHRSRATRRGRARVRLEQGHDRRHHAQPKPCEQARLGRDGHWRQPRHPHVAGLRPARRRGGAHDAAAGGSGPMEGAGRRAHGVQGRHQPRGEQAQDQLRQGCCGRVEGDAAGSEGDQAQGPERLDHRRQAAEAARHRGQAQRQQALCDRHQAAGDVVRRDQGLSGVRRQAEELRRNENRRNARREEGGEGEGHRRCGCRRHLVARQEGARCAPHRLGRSRQRRCFERQHRRAAQGRAGFGHDQR